MPRKRVHKNAWPWFGPFAWSGDHLPLVVYCDPSGLKWNLNYCWNVCLQHRHNMTQEGVHLSLNEESIETIHGSAGTVKLPQGGTGLVWFPYGNFKAHTKWCLQPMPVRAVWCYYNGNVWPHFPRTMCGDERAACLLIDERSEKSVDSKEIPLLTTSATVMLQMLGLHWSLNRRYCKMISCSGARNKYLSPVDDIVGYVQSESRECCQYVHGVSLQE